MISVKHALRKHIFQKLSVLQGDPGHPICPVMLGDAKLASTFADDMLGKIKLIISSLFLFI